MRILFFNHNMRQGGAQSVTCSLLNEFCKIEEVDLCAVCETKKSNLFFSKLDPRVKVYSLGKKKVGFNLKILWSVWKFLFHGKHYDIVHINSYFVYFRNRLHLGVDNFIRIGFILLFLFSSFYTLIERHMVIMILILSVCFLLSFRDNYLCSKSEMMILNLLLMISFLLPFRVQRGQYRAANIQNIVFSSLPQIWNNTYEDKEIYRYMDNSGDFEPI